jgi:hypothetical protein
MRHTFSGSTAAIKLPTVKLELTHKQVRFIQPGAADKL